MRLIVSQNIERISEDFDDDDPDFINSIIDFLKDIGWIKQDRISGLYQVTEIGSTKANASKRVTVIQ